jgi:hypothetical protein
MHHLLLIQRTYEHDLSESSAKDGRQTLVESPHPNFDTCRGVVHPGVSLGIHDSLAGTSTLDDLIQLLFSGKSR